MLFTGETVNAQLCLPFITASGPTTFCSGGSVVLTVSVEGGDIKTIQWKKNGADISGATSYSYTATTSGNYTASTTCNKVIIPKVNGNNNNQPSGISNIIIVTVTTCEGNYNTLTGIDAGKSLTTGNYNTFTGYHSGYKTDAADWNTAVGTYALHDNTSGYSNVASGGNALYYNTSGYENTAIGTSALKHNTIGYFNTALGRGSLFNSTSANWNTALGRYSMYYNTTGYENTATGGQALYHNTTGYKNVATGINSLYDNTSGDYNAAHGRQSLFLNTTGSYNTASGSYALQSNTTGNNNTGLGYNANVTSGALSNATVIGYYATVDASNKVRIGNTSVTSIGGQVGWTVYSDARIKNEVKENVPGLSFIKNLRPVTYKYLLQKEKELLGVKDDSSNWQGKNDIEKVNYTGFIAQEVAAAAKKIDYDFSGIDNTGKIMGLRYAEFVVPLVKAVQELAAKNEKLENELASIKEMLANQNNGSLSASEQHNQSILATIGDKASLEQNAPNPFNSNTVIRFHLPSEVKNAQIIISDLNGHVLKTLALPNKGAGQVTLNASNLSAGTYLYSLVVDGKKMDSKQMILTK